MEKTSTKNQAEKLRFLRGIAVFAAVAVFGSLGFGLWSIRLTKAQDTGISDQETQEILDLNAQINEKRKQLEDLEKRAQSYQETARQKEREASSLQNQVESIESELESIATEIERATVEIEKIRLEIQQVEGSIEKRSKEIDDAKGRIGDFLRMMYRNSSQSYLEISLLNKTFSQYFMRSKAVHDVEGEMKKSLERLSVLKKDLELQQESLSAKHAEAEEAKTRLESNKTAQEQERLFKEELIGKAQEAAVTYQQLTEEAKSEYDSSIATADALERRFREKLAESGVDIDELLGTASQLAWPVSSRLITAYFHDANYPFGTHSGLDIGIPQGTPVRAAADGYVASVQAPYMIGPGRPGYAWVRLSHGGDISTFYLHLSQVSVTPDQFVRKGELIGLSGGARGVAGSGWLTTGPHLHFEVRSNGFPVNPLDYLP